MPDANQLVYWILGVLGAVVLLAFFLKPFRVLLRYIVQTILGFFGLLAVNYAGSFVGLSVGVNLINALLVGVLGLPGLGALLVLQWIY